MALATSADELIFDEDERGPSDALRLQFEAISNMPEQQQAVIRELLEGMIIKYETQRWGQQQT